MDESSTLDVLLPLAGVVLGWALGTLTTAITTRRERAWAEKQTVREREEAAASALDQALVEVVKHTPQAQLDAREAQKPLAESHAMLREAWSRATVLMDPGIAERMKALDLAMFVAGQESRLANRGSTVNFWPLAIGFRDVRKALAAFIRREPLPEPDFPTSDELVALTSSGGREPGFNALWEELLKRGVV